MTINARDGVEPKPILGITQLCFCRRVRCTRRISAARPQFQAANLRTVVVRRSAFTESVHRRVVEWSSGRVVKGRGRGPVPLSLRCASCAGWCPSRPRRSCRETPPRIQRRLRPCSGHRAAGYPPRAQRDREDGSLCVLGDSGQCLDALKFCRGLPHHHGSVGGGVVWGAPLDRHEDRRRPAGTALYVLKGVRRDPCGFQCGLLLRAFHDLDVRLANSLRACGEVN